MAAMKFRDTQLKEHVKCALHLQELKKTTVIVKQINVIIIQQQILQVFANIAHKVKFQMQEQDHVSHLELEIKMELVMTDNSQTQMMDIHVSIVPNSLEFKTQGFVGKISVDQILLTHQMEGVQHVQMG